MDSTLAPPTQSRLRIAHALLDELGHQVDVRVLHIKGVALDAEFSEGRHQSSDCDVMVHPGDAAAYGKHLEKNGWELRTRFRHGSVFQHAATYYHRVWGTVDLHRSFPGVDSDPDATFNAWWQQRQSAHIGGRIMAVPSALDQRVLLILHAARSSQGKKSHDFATAWIKATNDTKLSVEQRVRELGGTVPFLIITDPGDGSRIQQAAGMPRFHLWQAVSRGANPTEIWSAQLDDATSVREKLSIMWQAAHVNRDHLAIQLGHDPSPAELRKEWWMRLGRGARRISRILRGTTPEHNAK